MVWDRKTNQATESSQTVAVEDHQAPKKGDEKWDKIADKKEVSNEQQAPEGNDQQTIGKEELQVILVDQSKGTANQ